MFVASRAYPLADKISQEKNQAKWQDRAQKPQRKARLMRVTPEIFDLIYSDRVAADDHESAAFLTIGRLLRRSPNRNAKNRNYTR